MISKIPQTLVCGFFFVRSCGEISKRRCQRIKILHLLILPEAQKVNAPDREKEMRKKKFPALGGRLRAARTGRAARPYFLKG